MENLAQRWEQQHERPSRNIQLVITGVDHPDDSAMTREKQLILNRNVANDDEGNDDGGQDDDQSAEDDKVQKRDIPEKDDDAAQNDDGTADVDPDAKSGSNVADKSKSTDARNKNGVIVGAGRTPSPVTARSPVAAPTSNRAPTITTTKTAPGPIITSLVTLTPVATKTRSKPSATTPSRLSAPTNPTDLAPATSRFIPMSSSPSTATTATIPSKSISAMGPSLVLSKVPSFPNRIPQSPVRTPVSRPAMAPVASPLRQRDSNMGAPPSKQSPTNNMKQSSCSSVTDVACQVSSHPIQSMAGVLLLILLCYCWRRRAGNSDLDGSRGEYRRVASRFTADAFDDALDDNDLDGYVDDDDGDGGSYYANGTTKHVLEMSELDNGRLSLKEVNG
jgi:hypothetical protein